MKPTFTVFIIVLYLFPSEGNFLGAQPPSSKVFEIDRINLGLAKGLLESSAPFSRLGLHNQDGSLRSTTAHDALLAQKIASQLRSEFQKSLSFSPAAVSLWATDLIAVAEKIESAGGYTNITLGSAIRWVAMDSLFFAFSGGLSPSKDTLDALRRSYRTYLQIETIQDDLDYSGLDADQVRELKDTPDRFKKATMFILCFGLGYGNKNLKGPSVAIFHVEPLSQALKTKSLRKLLVAMGGTAISASSALYPYGLAISKGGNPKELLLKEGEWLKALGSREIELLDSVGDSKSTSVSSALMILNEGTYFRKELRCASKACAAALQ